MEEEGGTREAAAHQVAGGGGRQAGGEDNQGEGKPGREGAGEAAAAAAEVAGAVLGPEGVSRPCRRRRFPCPLQKSMEKPVGRRGQSQEATAGSVDFPQISLPLPSSHPSPLGPSLLAQIPGTSVGRPQTHLALSIGLGRLPGSSWFPTPCRCHILKTRRGRRGCAGPVTWPRRGLAPCVPSPWAHAAVLFLFLGVRGQEGKLGTLLLQQHLNAGVQAAVLSKGHALVGGLWGWGAGTGR